MLVVTLAALTVLGLWAAAGLASEEDAAAPAVKFHTDAAAMQRDAAAAIDALLADDLEQLRPIVERMEAGCRKLTPEEGAALGPYFRNRDQALHVVLNGTLGWIEQEKPNEAFTEFLWVLRTCRECHALARSSGYLPPRGPIR
jgi:hypothetical protein